MPSLHQKQRVRNKTFPLVYCNIKNPWASRCFRCSSSWAIEIKTQPVALIINKLKIMQSIFTFSLRRFHNKQVYGCDQTAKVSSLIVNPIFSMCSGIPIISRKTITQKFFPVIYKALWHELMSFNLTIRPFFVCRGLQFWQCYSFSRCPMQPKFIDQCNFGFTPNTPT